MFINFIHLVASPISNPLFLMCILSLPKIPINVDFMLCHTNYCKHHTNWQQGNFLLHDWNKLYWKWCHMVWILEYYTKYSKYCGWWIVVGRNLPWPTIVTNCTKIIVGCKTPLSRLGYRVLLSGTQYCQACFNVFESACSAMLFRKPSRWALP
jgi:hypothetical protein